MKRIIQLIALAISALTLSSAAQTKPDARPAPPIAIKGAINIQYNSRQKPGVKGVKDIYSVDLNFANSSLFQGTIADTPQIIDGYFNKSVVQRRLLEYSIDLDVVNPRNPSQTKNVGRMSGNVPISPDGVYHYDTGTLQVDVLPIGSAAGFTSKFDGLANGKPLSRPANWLDTLERQAVNITRSVNGRPVTVVLKKYDKMEFRQHIIAGGPVQIYQPVTVNGEMLYDYDKNCWFFNNFNVQYADGGVIKVDHVTGTIRWVESKDRATTGEGEYQFDVRVNEPPATDGAAFASPTDESSFFTTDTAVPALTGAMKYKDTLRGDTTLASAVTIDLTGNNITKQQAMVLTKIIIFSSVVPMNSD